MYVPDALILLLCLSTEVYKYPRSLNLFSLLSIASQSIHDIFSVLLAMVKCTQAIVCLTFLQLALNLQSSACFPHEDQAGQPGSREPNVESISAK